MLLFDIIPALREPDTSVLNAARVDINLARPTKFRGKLKRLLARPGTRVRRRGRIISRNFLRDRTRRPPVRRYKLISSTDKLSVETLEICLAATAPTHMLTANTVACINASSTVRKASFRSIVLHAWIQVAQIYISRLTSS